MYLGRLTFGIILAAWQLSGQSFTGMTCTGEVEAPREVDANTATGPMGDFMITCTGGTPTPAGQPVPILEFEVRTEPPLRFTNRPLEIPGFNTYVDSVLIIDDPTPQNLTMCVPQSGPDPDSCPGSRIGTGDGKGTYDPNASGPQRGNTWLADFDSEYAPQFVLSYTVGWDPPGPDGQRKARIASVYFDPSGLGVRRGEQKEVQMRVDVKAREPVHFGPYFGTSATVRESVDSDILGGTWFGCDNHEFKTGLPGGTDPTILLNSIYTEEYAIGMRRRLADRGFRREKQDDGSWPYDIGDEDFGTVLGLLIGNVPAGVQLYGERVVTDGSTRAELETTTPSTDPWVLVPVNNGQADLRWQIVSADDTRLERLTPRVGISYKANEAAAGIISAKTYLAPSDEYPRHTIPRYYSSQPQDPNRNGEAAVAINSCASRDTVNQSFALTSGLFPITYFQQGLPAEEGKTYVFSSGAPNRDVTVEVVNTPWLTMTPNGTTTPVTIDMKINPDVLTSPSPGSAMASGGNLRAALLAPGNYTGTFRVRSSGAATTTLNVPLIVNPPGPHLTRPGVANAASYETEAVAPGEVLAFFGERFGPDALVTAQLVDGKFATTLGETRVLFDGVAAPMVYAARGQVSAIAPFGLAGKKGTRIQIEYRGVRSPAVNVPVAAAVPALLTANASGSGQAAALNQDNSFNSQIGALPGEYAVFFGVGGPATDVPGRDGELYAAPLPQFTGPVTVLLDGVEVPAADVAYVGPAPGLVQGVWQGNVKISANARRNSAVQVQFRFGDFVTQPGVTVSVR